MSYVNREFTWDLKALSEFWEDYVKPDATPTANSTKPVQSGGVYTEINGQTTYELPEGLKAANWQSLSRKVYYDDDALVFWTSGVQGTHIAQPLPNALTDVTCWKAVDTNFWDGNEPLIAKISYNVSQSVDLHVYYKYSATSSSFDILYCNVQQGEGETTFDIKALLKAAKPTTYRTITNITFGAMYATSASEYGTNQINVFGFETNVEGIKDTLERIDDEISAITDVVTEIEENSVIKVKRSDFISGGYININGIIVSNSDYSYTDYFELLTKDLPIVLYGVWSGSSSLVFCFYDETHTKVGNTYASINAILSPYTIPATDIPITAKYFRCGSRNAELSQNVYVSFGNLEALYKYIKTNSFENYIFKFPNSPNVLIFGDSISACCTLTINKTSNTTTAYTLRHPSNSFVNAGGTTIQFDMWPYFVKTLLNCYDLRNYAESGASYKTQTRESGYERQNLNYQITLALNDLSNPNSVFPTIGQYVPDIVIFALGTNDGNPTASETYETTMAKTVFDNDGYIDIDATLAALDTTNFADAIRWAFLTIKKNFPYALTFCVLPIQRWNNSFMDSSKCELIRKFAERHSIHIIDGAADMGIIQDLCKNINTYLKDGLHPNDKGQNLYARLVLSAIMNNYINLSLLNP